MATVLNSNIVAGIEDRLSTSIPNYTRLNYLEHSKLAVSQEAYNVRSAETTMDNFVSGIIVKQIFNVNLTKTYTPSQKSDDEKVNKIVEMHDDALILYKDIINNMKSIYSTVLSVDELYIDDAVIEDKADYATLTCSMLITYRLTIEEVRLLLLEDGNKLLTEDDFGIIL